MSEPDRVISFITEREGPVNVKNAFNSLLPILGILVILRGWSQYTDTPPKPSDEDQITHTDYISGNYQRDLEKRREEIARHRSRGRWYVLAGSSLILGGMYMLGRGLKSVNE